MSQSSANQKLDHLFRHEYGRLVALFTSRYASHMIDQIEDAVQEALYKAAKIWPYQEIPQNPQAWLYRVANNALIDGLRKTNRLEASDDPNLGDTAIQDEDVNELIDEQLQMIFACCHPTMKPAEQLMLSLKLLCGLSVKEISRALLKNEEATKKAITRAKKKFKEEVGELKVPEGKSLEERLSAVLQVIYLLFNEGYKATEGDRLIKNDLCEEAVRLGFLLMNEKSCDTHELHALIALMLFKAARFPARQNDEGQLITLEFQNRDSYDQEYINWAWKFLKRSSKSEYTSVYQLEAAISCYYTTAKTYEKTNWKSISLLYDSLVKLKPSPVVKMSQVVVISKLKGAEEALVLMKLVEEEIKDNQSFSALKADLLAETGNWNQARIHLQKAIAQADNIAERKYLENKLKQWREN